MITKNFSGALQLTDLDDFIGPSQQCIIPMQTKLAESNDDGLIKLRTKKSIKVEEESAPKIAKITLNDCLACSGCITSAESILIDQQDYREAQLGDSGEHDPEIYGNIARAYPKRVKRIFIRAVKGEKFDDARFVKAFKDVPREKWLIFNDPVKHLPKDLDTTALPTLSKKP
ncbi:unnamed protein product [Adineta steineri]|uniref:Phosphatidate phosphatase APP1 catalytic domain-containing protein n=1 Tax=Adineta steineri TaxID=433720 RepID=A0A815GC79_9BILA|nr:unnamed protein product [Adineta steineri]